MRISKNTDDLDSRIILKIVTTSTFAEITSNNRGFSKDFLDKNFRCHELNFYLSGFDENGAVLNLRFLASK